MRNTPGNKRPTLGDGRRKWQEPEPREPLSKERIISAAVEMLDERGFGGLTMRALGEQLGVEAMALYHYFPNKQALLEAVASEVDLAAFFGEFVAHCAAGDSSADTVVELGMRYLQFARENPSQFALLFCVLPLEYESWEELVGGNSTFRIPQGAVQKGIDTGEFVARPGFGVNEMSYALWAFVHGLATLRHTRLRTVQADYDGLHRALLEQFVETFKRGQPPEAPTRSDGEAHHVG
ncbi:MAG: TetR/AcrR family transcriptional regulator [Armatimonadetes bacterium]|nr:TetR/AcrR family transcriptional regulator [Armatimonadota bacterium]